jgi:DNA-directed RNA polymerase subunit beta'
VGIIAGQSIGEPGTQLTMRTFHSGDIANAQGDITQGLPRVSELFEARMSKGAALLAEFDGIVHIKQHAQTGNKMLHLISACGSDASDTPAELPAEQVYELAPAHALLVEDGQSVHQGTALTAGACHPPRILELQGREAAAHALVSEVQRIYRASGVYTNDKHLECILRQMLRYVLVTEPGDSSLLPGDLIDRFQYAQVNAATLAQEGTPALARPVLLGLTRTALRTASWIAAASFQETSGVLTAAAIRGQLDPLRGYKERVILGLSIPFPRSPNRT